MPQEGKDAISITRLPDLHALIVAAGDQHLLIGRPGDAVDPICMPRKGVHWCATTGGVPDLYCPVLARGGNQLTSRRPRYRRDLFCMTSVDEPARTSGSLENLNKSVVTG